MAMGSRGGLARPRANRNDHGWRAGRRWQALVAVALIGSALAVLTTTAGAVHDAGVMQLDGDARVQDHIVPSTATDDWDTICKATPSTCTFKTGQTPPAGAPHATFRASSFTNDGGLQASIFTGGGSKDPQPISAWAWKDNVGGLPDKDNLLDSFSAKYTVPAGSTCPNAAGSGPFTGDCQLLYFGSDRYDNSGDAQQGFWLFQNSIGTNADGSFSGQHKVGDLLIVSDFSVGGSTSIINVYQWVGSGGSDGALDFLGGNDTARCGASTADAFCGLVNGDPTPPVPCVNNPKKMCDPNTADDNQPVITPWTFLDKSGNATAANGEFYEGGINLSMLPGAIASECFSSFMSETRSSTSTTATLKDFVLGPLQHCGSTTTSDPENNDGTSIDNNTNPGHVSIGTGVVDVKDSATVEASGATVGVTGSVSFHLCGPAVTSCTTTTTSALGSGTPTGGTDIGSTPIPSGSGTTVTVESPVVHVSSAGTYCFRADYSGDTNYPASTDNSAGECFTVDPVTPTLTTQAGTSPAAFGSTITDSASLTGTANKPGSPIINPTTAGGPAGGTITFTLYGPNQCTTSPTGFPSGGIARSVSGNGTYPTASQSTVGFQVTTPNQPGTYHWVASYNGDSPNTNGATHNTACDDTHEDVVVQQIPTSISTTPSFIPNDSATISTGAGTVSGSVSFSLYDTLAHCQAGTSTGRLYGVETVNLAGGSASETVNTHNTATAVSTNGTYYWLVQYTSGDVAHTGRQSACSESIAATFTPDAGPGTLH